MYDYSYWDDQAVASAILGVFAVVWIVIVLVSVFITVCQWRIFTKAGQPGWKALIPFYSGWVFNQIIFGPQFGWLMFVSLIAFIPFVGSLAMIAWTVYTYVKLANAYGKSGGFGAFTVFFPVIGLPMLAFGSSQYCGPQAPFFSKNGVAVPNGQWQNPQQNAWGQPPAQPQQDPWGQTPAQPAQPPQWGQAPVQPQQDPWGTPNTGASAMNPGYQQQNPVNGWGVAQNPATPPVPPQDPWGTPPSTPQTPPQVPNDNSNPFI